MHREIVRELYRTLTLLGAQEDLLAAVSSWGNGLTDEAALTSLKAWNESTMREIRERIEGYEKPYPHQSRNRGALQQTFMGSH
jgi:hypothetical protein